MMDKEIPRWQYRLRNFERALALLREAIGQMNEANLIGGTFSDLEKEGTIQRFEYTWELAWKALNDYLKSEGVVLDKITPKSVIRASFRAKIISDGDTWMKALDARNKMAHTYDFEDFEKALGQIRDDFLPAMEELNAYLSGAESDGT